MRNPYSWGDFGRDRGDYLSSLTKPHWSTAPRWVVAPLPHSNNPMALVDKLPVWRLHILTTVKSVDSRWRSVLMAPAIRLEQLNCEISLLPSAALTNSCIQERRLRAARKCFPHGALALADRSLIASSKGHEPTLAKPPVSGHEGIRNAPKLETSLRTLFILEASSVYHV